MIRFSTFPRTEPPPTFSKTIVGVFKAHHSAISTEDLKKGLTSDDVLAVLATDLTTLGFEVETGKAKQQLIERPVFFGENGESTVRYKVTATTPNGDVGSRLKPVERGWETPSIGT